MCTTPPAFGMYLATVKGEIAANGGPGRALINDGNTDGDFSIAKMYNEFVQAMDYGQKSKEKFLAANDLETEDTGSREAAAEMRKLVKQIKDIYFPSIQEMARVEVINLD